jgi:predicted Fe-S protein YdhL (DUF1289 family)
MAYKAAMESPCINICTYDSESGLCRGCGRSLEEIGAWFSMTDEERRAVMSDERCAKARERVRGTCESDERREPKRAAGPERLRPPPAS